MRILEVINTLHLGGAETLLCDLVTEFRRQQVHADILCLGDNEFPLEKELKPLGIDVLHTSAANLYSLRQIRDIRSHVNAGRYDVVHSHLYPAQLWARAAVWLAGRGIPLVTTEHNTWNRRRYWWYRPLDRWMYAGYAAIPCIGATTETALNAWFPAERLPTMIVENGINLERFSRVPSRGSGASEITRLICVASLSDRKGQEVLLAAIKELPNVEATLVGEGPERPKLERVARDLGIEHRVHFLGNRRDIPELLAASDIYVQPSHWEGFGIATVEAMASGLPIIATDVPGLREVVGDGGLLFPAGSSQELRQRIESLLADPELRASLAVKAKKRSESFSVAATAAEYLRIYESVLR